MLCGHCLKLLFCFIPTGYVFSLRSSSDWLRFFFKELKLAINEIVQKRWKKMVRSPVKQKSKMRTATTKGTDKCDTVSEESGELVIINDAFAYADLDEGGLHAYNKGVLRRQMTRHKTINSFAGKVHDVIDLTTDDLPTPATDAAVVPTATCIPTAHRVSVQEEFEDPCDCEGTIRPSHVSAYAFHPVQGMLNRIKNDPGSRYLDPSECKSHGCAFCTGTYMSQRWHLLKRLYQLNTQLRVGDDPW